MSEVQTNRMFISNKWYDRLKFIAQIVLPAIATFYFVLADTWNLPRAEQVVGTITAIDALLGAILGVSTSKYNASPARYDGKMIVREQSTATGESKTVFSLEFDGDPMELADLAQTTFKVEDQRKS